MLRYDFHIHSALSPCGDNDMTPGNIVGMAYIAGVNVIAVTDHNTVGNVPAAQKAGEKLGVTVLPGMEIESSEEVHILTLYKDFQSAKQVADIVYAHLPDIKNRPDIFGHQYFINEDDEIVGEEEKLLISPTALSIDEVFKLVGEAGGFALPAHVDRHSYSVLTNLGFIPPELNCSYIEISSRVDNPKEYLSERSDLAGYRFLQNSDAHYLKDIAVRENYLECEISELFGK